MTEMWPSALDNLLLMFLRIRKLMHGCLPKRLEVRVEKGSVAHYSSINLFNVELLNAKTKLVSVDAKSNFI
jgi:hypothetical protein